MSPDDRAPAMTRGDRLVLGALFGMFAVAVGNTTGAAVAIPAIGVAFDAGPADVGWVVFGYSGAFAVATAVYGTLARRYGLTRCLVAGAACVVVGGLLAVAAAGLPMLIAGRVVQGLGSGALPTLSVALIARRMTGATRQRAIGINIAAVGVGFALGPLVAGIALETVGWRGAVALGILVAPAAPVLWRHEAQWDTPNPDARLDPLGIGLVASLVGSLTFLLNRGPILGLSPATTLAAALLAASAASLTAWLRVRSQAVFPWPIVTSRRLWSLMVLGFVGQAAFLGTLVIVPVAAAMAHGVDGLLLGLLLVPMATLVAVLSPRNGQVQARIGRPATTTLALGVIALGSVLLAALGAEVAPIVMATGLVVGAVGFSILNAPLANEVTTAFDGDKRSVALGLYNLAFFMGTTAGSSLTTAIVQAELDVAALRDAEVPGYPTALVVVSSAAAVVALARLGSAAAMGLLRRRRRLGAVSRVPERRTP